MGVPPRILLTCHDEAARFVQLLMAPGSEGLVQEDFVPLLQVRGTGEHKCVDRWTHGQKRGQTNRQAHSDPGRHRHAHTDRWAQKWKDRQTDSQREICTRTHTRRDTRTDGHAD